jgi:hypothetical protein
MNILEKIASAGDGSRCFGSGTFSCVRGSAPSIVIVPITNGPLSGCHASGDGHTHKALVFCGDTPVYALCITKEQVDELSRGWSTEFEAHVVVLPTVPEPIAQFITCPPPTNKLTDTEAAAALAMERNNIRGLMAWARSPEGSTTLGIKSPAA